MNQISIQNITLQGMEKKDNQTNPKDTVIRRNNPSKKKIHPNNANIRNSNQNQPPQNQQIQKVRKMPQKPTLIIQKKSSTNFNNQNIYNNLWLNKVFIYCHETLNNYLNKPDFKSTLDKFQDNYNKLIHQFRRQKPINEVVNNIKAPSQLSNNIDNKGIKQNQLEKKKKFIVTGGYCDVVNNLKIRGWEQEPNSKNLEFDYIWTLKTNEINFMVLKNYQLCNHYFRNGQITRKSGLCKNIKNLYFHGISPMNFFPRCYDLSVKTELEDFKQDFKFTWAISLLKLLQKEEKETSRMSETSKKFSAKVISTALDIVERNIDLIKRTVDYNDLRNMNRKIYLVTDEEWDIIYLPELTQTSNVQDIIYEVNSNKPGGVNNPIKSGNKTVPKRIIRKPNETKNMLINIQKDKVGATDTNKFSPNLKSITGLKSKINQMNNEEKKNNTKPNENNANSLFNNNNKNSIIKKNIDFAVFSDFKDKISKILDTLQKFLPQYKLNGYRNIWIMKPSNLSRGRGVTCVDSLLPIEQSLSATNDSGVIVL